MRWGRKSGQWIQGGADLAQTWSFSANKQGWHRAAATNSRHAARMAIGLGFFGTPAQLGAGRWVAPGGRLNSGRVVVRSSWWLRLWLWLRRWWWCFFPSPRPRSVSRVRAAQRSMSVGCMFRAAKLGGRRNLRLLTSFTHPAASSEASAGRYTANGLAWPGVIARHRSLAAVCARGKARPSCRADTTRNQPPTAASRSPRTTPASAQTHWHASGTDTWSARPGNAASQETWETWKQVWRALAAPVACRPPVLRPAPSNAAAAAAELAHPDASSPSV